MWIYREVAYEALRLAEQEKGGPVNLPELVRAYRKITKTPLLVPHILTAAIMDFYWNDQILGDREINYISINPKLQHTEANPTGFDLYSDRITRAFPSYVIDKEMRVTPGP